MAGISRSSLTRSASDRPSSRKSLGGAGRRSTSRRMCERPKPNFSRFSRVARPVSSSHQDQLTKGSSSTGPSQRLCRRANRSCVSAPVGIWQRRSATQERVKVRLLHFGLLSSAAGMTTRILQPQQIRLVTGVSAYKRATNFAGILTHRRTRQLSRSSLIAHA